MEPIELSEKFLMDTGGWKEMKEARMIVAAGAVREAMYQANRLQGIVRSGSKDFAAGLEFHSRTHVDNRCTCLRSKREGIICSHSLAVGLAVLDHGPAKVEIAPAQEQPAPVSDWPEISTDPVEGAQLLQLSVLLPPNFAAGWEKNRVPAILEMDLGDGPCQLAALKKSGKYWVGDEDAGLLDWLRSISPAEPASMLAVEQEQFLNLLDACTAHPRITLGRDQRIEISPEPIFPTLTLQGLNVAAKLPPGALASEAGAWQWMPPVFHPVAPGLPSRFGKLLTRGLVLDAESAARDLAMLSDFFTIPPDLAYYLPTPMAPDVRLEIEGTLNGLNAVISFEYGGLDRPLDPAQGAILFETPEGHAATTSPSLEGDAYGRLMAAGFLPGKKQGEFQLKDRTEILHFFAFGRESLPANWKVILRDMATHADNQVVRVRPAVEAHWAGSGEDWFRVQVDYVAADDSRMSMSEVQRLLRGGTSHAKRPDGKTLVLDESAIEGLDAAIADCSPQQHQPGSFRLRTANVDFLQESAAALGVPMQGTERKEAPVIPLTAAWKKTLRPYQQTGVEWMLTALQKFRGGLLADDMGLGKTVQCLSVIDTGNFRTLVIAPASLLENWRAEAYRFIPGRRCEVAASGQALGALDLSAADIVITSYGLLRGHAEIFARSDFDLVVLDEAQNIKNPDSQAAKAAVRLKASRRLALTGTPLENSPLDLWSISRFVVPGYLGDLSFFKERFLAGAQDAETLHRLGRRIAPIVLRREKSEVAKDLPPRIEQEHHCNLTSAQQSVYADFLKAARQRIDSAQDDQQKRMMALTALLRLRQICCDLRLLGGASAEEFTESDSGKLVLLLDLLEQSIAAGHRTLVFSQFTSMLHLIQDALRSREIEHCYLDGSTRKRHMEVERFQNNAHIPVFLISLKAGGVGLNLTGADHVIHFDPWWNPAVEAQATDRAHRIGQSKTVLSYRLFTRNTVEEKMAAVLQKKRDLSKGLFSASTTGFDQTEILSLL